MTAQHGVQQSAREGHAPSKPSPSPRSSWPGEGESLSRPHRPPRMSEYRILRIKDMTSTGGGVYTFS